LTAPREAGLPFLPYGRQSVDANDVSAVVDVLEGDWLTQGPSIGEFEAALAEVTTARHVVAFSSGTSALHGACAAAGLGPGDRVGVPALTFAASVACAVHVGASPALLDVDPATLNLDPAAVPSGLAGLVAVHYAGLPVDLSRLAHRPRVVIEDAAHALGARTPEGPVGSCTHSDLCCFSFHPVKPITTAEGGAVTTNDAALAERLRSFRSHGTVPAPERGPWAYDIGVAGFNFRITDLQCALGTSQLGRLEEFIARRNHLADRYRRLLADLPVQLPPAAAPGWRHGYHLFAVRVADRRRVYDDLRARGIGVQVHWVPIHHHTAFRHLATRSGLPGTEEVYAGLLSLPLFPAMTEPDQDRVVDALGAVL
jgi:dTDP-4-amino-4,6-dideoxygalactose transaminase